MDPNYLHIFMLWIPYTIYKALCADLFMWDELEDYFINPIGVVLASAVLTGFTWLVLSWCLGL